MKKWSRFLIISILFFAVTIALSQKAYANTWEIGSTVGLCSGTEIREGSGFNYSVHTIVPEDNWTVVVIDGPRYVDGKAWWDISRAATGDPSGGTGWVYQSQADLCLGAGGGGDGDGSGDGNGDGNQYDDGNLDRPILETNAQPPIANSGFTWPLEGIDIEKQDYIGYNSFDTHCSGYHHGKDFYVAHPNNESHPKIHAVADGKVVVSKVQADNKGFGTYIIIWHVMPDGRDVFSVYAHLYPGTARVEVNQSVKRGDWIARQDTSGTGSNDIEHLHFELRKYAFPGKVNSEAKCPATIAISDKYYYDPAEFIPAHFRGDPTYLEKVTITNEGVSTTEDVKNESTIDPGEETGIFQFFVNSAKRLLSIVLGFPGSSLEITVYKPDGSIYGVYQTDEPPLLVTIPDPEEGEWGYSIRAIEVPYDDYPYVVSIGSREEVLLHAGTIYESDSFEGYTGDITPPSTSIIANPSLPNGNNGWYVSPVEISFSSSDNAGGVGVAATRYSLDGGKNYITYTEPFSIATEGVNVITYYSVDGLGNKETEQTHTFNIDLTPPIVSVWTDQTQYTRVEPLIIHYNGYDPEPGSGLLDITGSLNGVSVLDGEFVDLFWFTLDNYSIVSTAEDYAGWVTVEDVSFEMIATIDSLQTSVDRLCDENFITNKGTCKSLSQKLDNAHKAYTRGRINAAVNILKAFQNQVNAQTGPQRGKHINPAAASILLMDSTYVIEHLDAN